MSKIDITSDVYVKAWSDFKGDDWKRSTNVADFVQHNYRPYDDDESFLSGPTQRTIEVNELMKATKDRYEKEGRFPMDTQPTSIAEIGPGYVDQDKDIIFGLQNDELFKLNFMPKGGIRMAETALIEHGYEPDPLVHEIYTKHATTVNDGIFRAYSNDIRRARHSGLITGLPDALVA